MTFGNYPLKTYFTPSFKVPLYQFGEMDHSDLDERSFDEKNAFYDIRFRNKRVLEKNSGPAATQKKVEEKTDEKKVDINELDYATLLQLFVEFQKTHPGITIKDFVAMVEDGSIPLRKEPNQ